MSVSELPIENVEDYPRPPLLERVSLTLAIDFDGERIAEAEGGWRVCETYHPPTYYLPFEAFRDGVLQPTGGRSVCEWKGRASYFDVISRGRSARRAAWHYPVPTPDFDELKRHVAVYADPMDVCWVGDVRVIPQPGNFYGGWVTPNLTGRIKGAPGTLHW